VITLEERVPVLLSMGAATFPKDGEDFDELLHWCRARVADQRGSLVRRLHLGDLPENAFWELVDLLLEAGSRLPESSPSAQLPANPGLFAAVQREAAREVARDPRARGLLFVGGPSALASDALGALPAGEGMARAGDEPTRVYLLGPRGGGEAPSHPLVTPGGARRGRAHRRLRVPAAPRRERLLRPGPGAGRTALPLVRRPAGGLAGGEAPGALRPPAPFDPEPDGRPP